MYGAESAMMVRKRGREGKRIGWMGSCMRERHCEEFGTVSASFLVDSSELARCGGNVAIRKGN